MRTVAVIPARGGSKGLLRKNVRTVGGVPLVGRTAEAARGAMSVDQTFVSTYDPEIADVAREHGAKVIDRPVALSGDGASSESVLLHALEHLADTNDLHPERLVFLQCTSPFTRPADIDGAVATFDANDADVAFAATPFHGFVWRRRGDGTVTGANHDADTPRQRRQDRPDELLETGAAYVLDVPGFREAEHRFFGRVVPHEVPEARSLEIDTAADLRRARALHADRARQDRRAALPTSIEAVVFDFDGVFTDNRVLVSQDETEAVVCDRGDGKGIEMLRETECSLLVLSSEINPVVRARTRKLDLQAVHGVDDKPSVLAEWLDDHGVQWNRTVFVGNDVNDIGCLRRAGCGVAVADAYEDARSAADLVLERRGGHGAVRELCDLVRSSSSSASSA